MKKVDFPLFKTKSPAGSPKFDLSDPKERKKYFQFKAGEEIRKIRDYLKDNTFLAVLLGKKSSGKGTYSKLFAEAVGSKNIVHVSAGDIVRSVDEEVRDPERRKKLESFLKDNYRGWLPIEKIIEAQLSRSTKKLLPTEFVLALLKREIAKLGKKAVFLDGFPRDLDQISYSLFFRDLVDYRDDPDFFVLIDVPMNVIEERMRYRVICPKCQTSRNTKLFVSKKIDYDQKKKKFHLICDNPKCQEARMKAKEGDHLGIKPIKKRLNLDEKLIRQAFSLYGIPKILLRNTVPVNKAKEYIDSYEITPEYVCRWNPKKSKVEVKEKPWIIKDDEGFPCYSLLAPPVAISLIKQLADLLP